MLLIESRASRRDELASHLETVGLHVTTAGRIADVERWPAGEVVVTEAGRFTPFWKDVGASHVVVLADTAHEGAEACRRGATAWLPRGCSAGALQQVLLTVGAGAPAAGSVTCPDPLARGVTTS